VVANGGDYLGDWRGCTTKSSMEDQLLISKELGPTRVPIGDYACAAIPRGGDYVHVATPWAVNCASVATREGRYHARVDAPGGWDCVRVATIIGGGCDVLYLSGIVGVHTGSTWSYYTDCVARGWEILRVRDRGDRGFY
jgi:hypothetical protein